MRLQEIYKRFGKGAKFKSCKSEQSPTWVMDKKLSKTQYIVHTLSHNAGLKQLSNIKFKSSFVTFVLSSFILTSPLTFL